MTQAHTPGPWHVGEMPGWSGICITRKPAHEYGPQGTIGDAPIAQVIARSPHWETCYPVEANARLIAAAPELLEALENIDETFIDDLSIDYDSATGKAILAARALIAKARGEA